MAQVFARDGPAARRPVAPARKGNGTLAEGGGGDRRGRFGCYDNRRSVVARGVDGDGRTIARRRVADRLAGAGGWSALEQALMASLIAVASVVHSTRRPCCGTQDRRPSTVIPLTRSGTGVADSDRRDARGRHPRILPRRIPGGAAVRVQGGGRAPAHRRLVLVSGVGGIAGSQVRTVAPLPGLGDISVDAAAQIAGAGTLDTVAVVLHRRPANAAGRCRGPGHRRVGRRIERTV